MCFANQSVHEDIARAGERFLLIVYGYCQTSSIKGDIGMRPMPT